MQNPNLLIDKLPTTVKVNGAEYSVFSDFRTFILLEILLFGGEHSRNEQIDIGCALVYGENNVPPDKDEAFSMALWFYRCGHEGKAGGNTEQAYCFEREDDLIFSAFYQQYGIDLAEVEYMHWWKFRALFSALRDTVISDLISARLYTGTDKGKLELKQKVALPQIQTKESQEALEDFNAIFYGS